MIKLFTKNTLRSLGLSLLGAVLLSSCGGGGSCAGCSPAVSTPVVTVVLSANDTGSELITGGIDENTDFYVVYTLTGGYQVADETYGVDLANASGGSPPMSVVGNPTCTISSQQTRCSIKLNSGGVASNQLITYTNPGGTMAPSSSSSPTFNVLFVPAITVTSSRLPVAGFESAVITATVPTAVSADTVVNFSVPSASTLYGFNAAAPYANTTSCTILNGQTSCSTTGANNLYAAVSTVGTDINLTASSSGYRESAISMKIAGVIYYTINYISPASQGLTADLKGQAQTSSGGAVANGVAGADYFCNTNANKPSGADGAIYKALISVAGIRNIEYDVNPAVDWVLKPEQPYVRAATPGARFSSDFITIGVTNASSIFGFPLESGIVASAPYTTPSLFYAWTGLNSDWTPLLDNCSEYTSTTSVVGASKRAGWVFQSPNVITTSAVIKQEVNAIFCNDGKTGSSRRMGLICVQQ